MDTSEFAKHFLPGATFAALAGGIVGFIVKTYIEKLFARVEKSAEELRSTSLAMKRDMRTEERGVLVAFRVAVEKWENFLQTLLFDFSMTPSLQADVADLYKSDKELFLEVKIAVVKASTYLRNQELERDLMAAVFRLRQTYYPLINEFLPRLMDLQTQMAPIERKMKKFAESAVPDMASAPTPKDLEDSLAIQQQMNGVMREFSEKLLGNYKDIAEQLVSLKEAVNQYIYRPVTQAQVDAD